MTAWARRLIIHDEHSTNPLYSELIARMEPPEMPVPLGVIKCIDKPVYEDGLEEQVQVAKSKKGEGDLQALLTGTETWKV